MSGRRKAGGFTLVELLVVISIIGMLMSLLLPAVQAARESGRRTVCANNEHQLVIAMMNFESVRRFFPGYMNAPKLQTSASQLTAPLMGYVPFLFPYMERADLWNEWTTKNTFPTPYMELAVCPSDPPDTKTRNHLAYVVNGGLDTGLTAANQTAQLQATGVCFDHTGWTGNTATGSNPVNGPIIKVGMDYLSQSDGASNTLLLTENIQAANWTINNDGTGTVSATDGKAWAVAFKTRTTFLWSNVTTPALDQKINGNKVKPPAAFGTFTLSRPSSNHTGGVNAHFCDGHYKFIAEEVDYLIYRQLMSSNNGLLPSGYLIATPIDDSMY